MHRRPAIRVAAVQITALFLLLLGYAVHAGFRPSSLQQQTERSSVLSSRTDLVAIPVTVVDAHGDFVPGLMAKNFRVFEDGEPQSLTLFEQEDTPVTVGLIVDHSGSMGPKLSEVAAAVRAFASSSNSDDEMFVVDFADTVSVEMVQGKAFTSDPQELSQAVTAVSASGRTALYDAVAAGLTHIQLGRWNKRALIVISDGGDNISRSTFPYVLAMARSSHAVIYAIGLVSESGQEENPGVLRRLCHETGGLVFFPPPGASAKETMERIARDLRGQYMLGYVPTMKDGPTHFHKLRVEVSVPNRNALHVRSRPGYSLGISSSDSNPSNFPRPVLR